jgi:hypothetical protein
MKKIALIFLWISSVNVFAQSSSVSITAPEYKMIRTPVATLYTGHNRVNIESSDPTMGRLLVMVDNVEAKEVVANEFDIDVKNPGNITLKIYNNADRKNPKLIETKTLNVIPAPEIKANILGKEGGKISRAELAKIETIDVSCVGCKNEKPVVTECKLSVAGKNVEYQEYSLSGNIIPDNLKSVIQNLPSGSKFLLEFIKVRISEGNPLNRLLPPLSFQITD